MTSDQKRPVARIPLTGLLEVALESMLAEFRVELERSEFADIRPTHGCVFRFVKGEGMRLTRLAELASITKQSAGEIVDDLVERGYAKRVPDPADRRAKLICLTERGEEAQARGFGLFAEVEERWIGALRPRHDRPAARDPRRDRRHRGARRRPRARTPRARERRDPVDLPPGAATAGPSDSLGGVAQLVRAPACHAGGRGFESRRSRSLECLHLSRFRARFRWEAYSPDLRLFGHQCPMETLAASLLQKRSEVWSAVTTSAFHLKTCPSR